MKIQIKKVLTIIFLVMFSVLSVVAKQDKAEKYNPVPSIMHHIADSHEWHLWGEGKNAITIPLPIILYTEGKIVFFMSSEFHHDDDAKVVFEYKEMKFVRFHSTIYQLNEGYNVANIDKHNHIQNGTKPLDLSITKNVASMMISMILLLLVLAAVAKKYKNPYKKPEGAQGFLEPLILFVQNDIIKDNIGPKHQRYLPFLLTVFFFILINNLMGLLPGAANVTGNIAVTLVLSLFTFIITTISGNKNYWGHIFSPPGVPLVLMPIMVPIEIIGIFTKPFALMIRLFANITAGHIIILSLISLIFIAQSTMGNGGAFSVAPISVLFVLFIYCIELLVAFLQAYIFTLLSAVFIGLAVHDEH